MPPMPGPSRPMDVPRCLPLGLLLPVLLALPAPAGRAPYPTEAHPQLVRQVHDAGNGLPAGAVRCIAAGPGGRIFVSAGGTLVQREGERWTECLGPAEVTALHLSGSAFLAGARDGVWELQRGAWRKQEGSPAAVLSFSEGPEGLVWALAESGVWQNDRKSTSAESRWRQVDAKDEDMGRTRALLVMPGGEAYIGAEKGLFRLMGKRRYWLRLEVGPGGLLSPDIRALAPLDSGQLLIATDRGVNLTNGRRGWLPLTGSEGLPVADLTAAAAAPDGTIWLGSTQGLVRYSGGRWIYLAGRRWLPDDRVTALWAAPDGGIWAGTPSGLAEISVRPMTLAQKAAEYQKVAEGRDRRHGYITLMHLPAPGVTAGATQELSDNDGLWTALYIAAQSYRWSVTRAPEAREQARRAMTALLRLESITGISGFPARAICHPSEPQFARRSARSLPEWHASPVEKGWYWKGDTSSDELDGHYLGWYAYHELAADAEEKKRVRATCKRVTDHLLDNGYYLVDRDGKPTTWGVWAPEKLNDDPAWWEERGLNSLEMLSHLKVAIHIVGEPRYRAAYRELIDRHHYALNAVQAKVAPPGGVSHDDQLAFLAFYPLLQLEKEPALRSLYLAGFRRLWQYERREASPFWSFLYGACTGEPHDVEAAVESLREMPLDLVMWKVRNSHRLDLRFDPEMERLGIRQLVRPLSWLERPLHKWDHSPYDLDGGSDLGEMDPTVWLLPYWLGRHHRLIE